MALFDDVLGGGNWGAGLAIGVGAVVVLPLVAPILRPVAKTAIKGGILAYQGAAELFEGISDLVAEAVAEAGGEATTQALEGGRAGHGDRAATARWDYVGSAGLTGTLPRRGITPLLVVSMLSPFRALASAPTSGAGRVSLPPRIMSRKARERINAQPL